MSASTSSSITSIATKQAALKERAAEEKVISAEIDKLVRIHVDGEVDAKSVGCFGKLVQCPSVLASWRRGRQIAVSTVECASAATTASSTCTLSQTESKRSEMATRLFGKAKKGAELPESVRIETAMRSVAVRVEQLNERLSAARKRALALKRAGKHEEAIREMKKAKGIEKQIGVANAAMDALERQEAVLAESNLQRELAAALSSTNSAVKQKQAGLLNLAEKAVDDSTEISDNVEDIGAVFEGLVSANDVGLDDDEVLGELEAMMHESEAEPERLAAAAIAAPAAPSAPVAPAASIPVPVSSFPKAPTTAVGVAAGGGSERAALLPG